MNNVVTLTPEFLTAELNRLPAHSRHRPGYVRILRNMKAQQLAVEILQQANQEARVHRQLVAALEEAFA